MKITEKLFGKFQFSTNGTPLQNVDTILDNGIVWFQEDMLPDENYHLYLRTYHIDHQHIKVETQLNSWYLESHGLASQVNMYLLERTLYLSLYLFRIMRC